MPSEPGLKPDAEPGPYLNQSWEQNQEGDKQQNQDLEKDQQNQDQEQVKDLDQEQNWDQDKEQNQDFHAVKFELAKSR